MPGARYYRRNDVGPKRGSRNRLIICAGVKLLGRQPGISKNPTRPKSKAGWVKSDYVSETLLPISNKAIIAAEMRGEAVKSKMPH